MLKWNKSIAIIVLLGFFSCGTTKEKANISNTPQITTDHRHAPNPVETVDGRAWFMRNPQFPGVPGPVTTPYLGEERHKITSNKAGRR